MREREIRERARERERGGGEIGGLEERSERKIDRLSKKGREKNRRGKEIKI